MTHTPRQPAIYIVTNKRHGTLYVGVTSNLIKRIHEHRTGATLGSAKQTAALSSCISSSTPTCRPP